MPLKSLLLTSLLLMGGCSEQFLRSTSSPAFGDGYKAGCDTGTARASNKTGAVARDEQRYLNDADYAQGWRSGNRECDGDNLRYNPNDSMQPIEIDGPMGVYER